MAKRGPKALPQNVVDLRGTAQPSRARTQVVPDLDGEPVRPKWLTGLARKVWDEKIKIYAARGQSVFGCESALAQYCQIEASLIEDFHKKKLVAPVTMVSQHRVYAGEFFDTPASKTTRTPAPKNGPFSGRGKR